MTIRHRTGVSLGSINTTKLLSITTSETLYTIESGNVALEATNLGSHDVYYGESNLLVTSGGLIISNGSKFWDSISGDFKLYFVLNTGGVSSNLIIHEYAGN